MKTLIVIASVALSACASVAAPKQSGAAATAAIPPCVTLKLNVTRFTHRLKSECSAQQLVTVEWQSRLHGKQTSSYRVGNGNLASPWERDIEIIDTNATVIRIEPVKTRCVANHCPKTNPARIKLKRSTVAGQSVYSVDNSTGSYVYVVATIVDFPGTPRERTSIAEDVLPPICKPDPNCHIAASLDPISAILVTAEEELR
jgi:hypothetical protein